MEENLQRSMAQPACFTDFKCKFKRFPILRARGPTRSSRPLVRLAVDIIGDILDVVGAELLAKGRHAAVAVGHLLDDGLNAVLAISNQGLLLDLLFGHDRIVAASVASGAIAGED